MGPGVAKRFFIADATPHADGHMHILIEAMDLPYLCLDPTQRIPLPR